MDAEPSVGPEPSAEADQLEISAWYDAETEWRAERFARDLAFEFAVAEAGRAQSELDDAEQLLADALDIAEHARDRAHAAADLFSQVAMLVAGDRP